MSDPRAELWALLSDGPMLHAIALAAQLGIPDLLAGGPRSAAELAEETWSDENALYRVLRALASAGVFAEEPERRFAATPMSDLLRSDTPGSLHPVAVLAGESWRRAWYDLPQVVRTGRPALERPFYESLDAEAARRFDAAQALKWESLASEVIAGYDFSHASRIVDVGGGSGALLDAVLAAHPQAEGVLFDSRPQATDDGAGHDVVAGDFTEAVPAGGDLYILAFVLHNWDDERAAAILRNCREALADGGRVLIVEAVVPDGPEPSPAKIHDLEMLVFMPGGRERTLAEYETLLEAAGLKLDRVIETNTSASLVVAFRAG